MSDQPIPSTTSGFDPATQRFEPRIPITLVSVAISSYIHYRLLRAGGDLRWNYLISLGAFWVVEYLANRGVTPRWRLYWCAACSAALLALWYFKP